MMPPTIPPRYVVLPGTERAPVPGARAVGPTPPDEPVRVSVYLRPRTELPDPALLGATPVDARPAPLTREQFAEQYGASPDDVARVRAFAEEAGLRVVDEDAARRTVVVEGTAAAMQRAFEVKLSRFVHPDGTEYRGRVGPVHVPESLAHAVDGVFGFDTRRTARSNAIIRPLPAAADFRAAAPRPWFTPPELGTLYEFPAGDGAGQCVGLLEFGGGFDTADLATYWGKVGVSPAPTVVAVPVGTGTNAPGKDPDSDGEVMLDIEVAGALAPRARLAVYFSTFTQQGWVDALTTAVHDATNRPSVLSVSWGYAEGHDTWTRAAINAVNDTLKAAALLGVTVCFASGDDGSSDEIADGHAHVDFPASSPYALGVGGTALVADATRTQITSEVVWNGGPRATGDGAGGGGISAVFPLPAFQATASVPPSVNPGHKRGRGVPDVAAVADPRTGYFIRSSGQDGVAGGTSAAAPLWAALLARINAAGATPVGYITPLLYASAGAAGCRDVIEGNNDPTGQVGGYAAGPGWDACTGWGSPNGRALGPALRTGGAAAGTVAAGGADTPGGPARPGARPPARPAVAGA
ncbi:kumamolisin [Gemmatimonadetes bacterium T265]|nr:kumamolisin [Gemmatimonadetes bacterium T265]